MSYVKIEVPRVTAGAGIGMRGNVTCQKQRCNLLLMKRTKQMSGEAAEERVAGSQKQMQGISKGEKS